MEVMLSDNTPLQELLVTINRFAPEGTYYNMTIGSTHPYTKEKCVFFYRTDKLKVFKASSYYDPDKTFYRRPLVVTFDALTLRDMDRFVVVGLHVKPNRAVEEMNGLANVYDYIRTNHRIDDVLLMGDFNADCSYVREGDWENITLWTREEFYWPIKNNVDTTTNYKKCTLDRFVYAGRNMNNGVIESSAAVFNFQEAYGLTTRQTREISDHLPIEIQIRGKMSKKAEKNLSSSTCVTVSDLQALKPLAKNFTSQVAAAGFRTILNLKDHMLILNKTADESLVVNSLKALRNKLPDIVSSDQLQAAIYKVRYGSLHDKTSFVALQDPTFWIALERRNQTQTIYICKQTNVN